MDRSTEYFCGVVLFTWVDWDVVDEYTNQYYNVEFSFDSMKQYNGMTAYYDLTGQLFIFDELDNVIYDGWIMKIPELREELHQKFS